MRVCSIQPAAVASFSVRLITGRASDRYGRGLFITISLSLYTIAMLMLWTANSAVTFLLAAMIEGAGAGILIPMIAAMLADRSLPQERGRLFGLCMVGFDVGIRDRWTCSRFCCRTSRLP